jgi:hypothetical protein
MAKGKIDVAMIPPKKKKKWKKKNGHLNRDDIVSVAKRIGTLDKRIANVNALSEERLELANHMQKLLKK